MKASRRHDLSDPFADNIVSEPRQIDSAVEPLNSLALEGVLASYRRLQSQPLPRLGAVQNAVVLLSPEPGYGKSHLIGRLFRRLGDDATLIYARPYQDPGSCWVGVLERIVTELDYPENTTAVIVEPGDLTQLDALARRVMVHLVGRLLEQGEHPEVHFPDQATDFFRRYPNSALETPEWRGWLADNFEALLPKLDALLASAGVHLVPRRSAWLRVLVKYAFSEGDLELRQTCLEWLRYKVLDPEDATTLGVRGGDLPESDIPFELRNERSFERVRELFKLAAFYRPFFVCFDQTELYGSSDALARTFGVVLSRLRRETKNHLVVVTANEHVWKTQIVAKFEEADRHVLNEPIHLEGVGKADARALVLRRLQFWDIPILEGERFADGWLDEMFEGEKSIHSARDVLREASRRWSNPPPITPKVLFESYRQRLLADPKRLDFDAGVFQLVLERILGPAVRADIKPVRSRNGYLTLEWGIEPRDVLFGFQGSSHWKTWEGTVREARQHYETRKQHGREMIARFFRTEELKRLPERSRKEIAQSECVRLVSLGRAEAARVYAAHDLYAEAQQGNLDVSMQDLLPFLHEELKDIVQAILGPGRQPSQPPATPPLADAIRDVVRAMKFATIEIVLGRVAPLHKNITRDSILEECRTLASVRVFTSPNSVMLRWIQSA
jgi:hypothetical protein